MSQYALSMRQLGPVLLAGFAIVGASAQESQALMDGLAWGSAVNGLRLGIALENPTKAAIRIVFENAGSQLLEVPLGYRNGRGAVYHLKFTAKSGNERILEAADVGMFYPVEGLVQPVLALLEPGRRFQLVLPLRNIFVHSSPANESLEVLVHRGYPLQVTFEAQDGDPSFSTSTPRHRWLGKVESAEVSSSR